MGGGSVQSVGAHSLVSCFLHTDSLFIQVKDVRLITYIIFSLSKDPIKKILKRQKGINLQGQSELPGEHLSLNNLDRKQMREENQQS